MPTKQTSYSTASHVLSGSSLHQKKANHLSLMFHQRTTLTGKRQKRDWRQDFKIFGKPAKFTPSGQFSNNCFLSNKVTFLLLFLEELHMLCLCVWKEGDGYHSAFSFEALLHVRIKLHHSEKAFFILYSFCNYSDYINLTSKRNFKKVLLAWSQHPKPFKKMLFPSMNTRTKPLLSYLGALDHGALIWYSGFINIMEC